MRDQIHTTAVRERHPDKLTQAALVAPNFDNVLVNVIVSMIIGALFGWASGQLAGVLPKSAAPAQ